MSTASHNRLAPGRLVCFVDPRTDEQRTGRIIEQEWAATYGNPQSRLTVRAGDTEVSITDADLCP
jgi:hypothetical protein